MGSHYRHLSANAWSPVTDGFKWGPLPDLPIFIYYGYLCIVLYIYIYIYIYIYYIYIYIYIWKVFCVIVCIGRERERERERERKRERDLKWWNALHTRFPIFLYCHNIYIYICSGCSSIQGIYAWLEGDIGICALFDIHRSAIRCAKIGVAVFKASMLDWLGGPSAFYVYALSEI